MERLTIDETIAFCHEKSNNIKLKAEPQVFIQLGELLEELKKRRSEDYDYMADIHQSIGYRKALDDFVKALCIEYSPVSDEMQNEYDNVCLRFEKIAEQLKAGGAE